MDDNQPDQTSVPALPTREPPQEYSPPQAFDPHAAEKYSHAASGHPQKYVQPDNNSGPVYPQLHNGQAKQFSHVYNVPAHNTQQYYHGTGQNNQYTDPAQYYHQTYHGPAHNNHHTLSGPANNGPAQSYLQNFHSQVQNYPQGFQSSGQNQPLAYNGTTQNNPQSHNDHANKDQQAFSQFLANDLQNYIATVHNYLHAYGGSIPDYAQMFSSLAQNNPEAKGGQTPALPQYNNGPAQHGQLAISGPTSNTLPNDKDPTKTQNSAAAEPEKMKPPKIHKDYKSQISNKLGIVQIIVGVLCAIFQSVEIGFQGAASYGAYGIWGGVTYIVTGALGIAAAKSQKRTLIIAFMVFCFFSIFSSVSLIVSTASAAVMASMTKANCTFDSMTGNISPEIMQREAFCQVSIDIIVAMNALMAAAAAIQHAVSIWGAVITNKVIGCCKNCKKTSKKVSCSCKKCKKMSKKKSKETVENIPMEISKNANAIPPQDENNLSSNLAGPLFNGPLSMLMASVPFQTFGAGHHGSSHIGSEPKLTYNVSSPVFGMPANVPSHHGLMPNYMANIAHPTFGTESGFHGPLHSLMAHVPFSHVGAGQQHAPIHHGFNPPAFSPEYNGLNYQGPQNTMPFAGPVFSNMHHMMHNMHTSSTT
jgi:hypothetical protein